MTVYNVQVNGHGEFWRYEGKLHREGDKPAVIYPDGKKFFYKNGKYHRDGDKPAVVRPDSSYEYWVDGFPHRWGGPAVVHKDGSCEYWVDGQKVTEQYAMQTPRKMTLSEISKKLGYPVEIVK